MSQTIRYHSLVLERTLGIVVKSKLSPTDDKFLPDFITTINSFLGDKGVNLQKNQVDSLLLSII